MEVIECNLLSCLSSPYSRSRFSILSCLPLLSSLIALPPLVLSPVVFPFLAVFVLSLYSILSCRPPVFVDYPPILSSLSFSVNLLSSFLFFVSLSFLSLLLIHSPHSLSFLVSPLFSRRPALYPPICIPSISSLSYVFSCYLLYLLCCIFLLLSFVSLSLSSISSFSSQYNIHKIRRIAQLIQ